jgi:hypothetical protein
MVVLNVNPRILINVLPLTELAEEEAVPQMAP